IASLTSYFTLLDLGVRGSVGRQMAFHRAKGDREGVNATLSTAVAFMLGLGALAMLALVAILPLFLWLFDVPPGQVASVRLALILIGANLAATLLTNLFDATLWSLQRFDLLNFAEIAAVLARAGLTVLLIGERHGLVTLALITLATTVGSAVAKGT